MREQLPRNEKRKRKPLFDPLSSSHSSPPLSSPHPSTHPNALVEESPHGVEAVGSRGKQHDADDACIEDHDVGVELVDEVGRPGIVHQ